MSLSDFSTASETDEEEQEEYELESLKQQNRDDTLWYSTYAWQTERQRLVPLLSNVSTQSLMSCFDDTLEPSVLPHRVDRHIYAMCQVLDDVEGLDVARLYHVLRNYNHNYQTRPLPRMRYR